MFATMQLPKTVLKRDGSLMPFDAYKIRNAIAKAAAATGNEMSTAATDLATEEIGRASCRERV